MIKLNKNIEVGYYTELSKNDGNRLLNDVLIAIKEGSIQKDVNPEGNSQMSYKEVILNRKDTAKLLDVSYVTLNNWAKQRTLIPRNIGNRVYYHMDDILKSMKPIYTNVDKNQ